MAQRKQLSWTELRVGLFVLAGLFLLAIGIFYVTGAGFVGPKYRLRTYLPEVEGLQQGAPVRLDGVEIGNVDSIRIAPNPPDRKHSIELVLRIDKKFQNEIRSDSTASLITEGLLGNRYVTISRGLTGNPVPPGGVVPGFEEAAIKQIVERGADLVQNLGALSTQVQEMVVKVQSGEGTLGKLLNDPTLYNRLSGTAGRLDSLVASVQQGQGTIGKLVTSDELYNRADTMVGHAEAMLAAVREQKGTVGKLIYDPTVYQDAKEFLEKGNATLTDVRAGKGTLGRLAIDETLYNNMRDASANVRDATAKLNSTEGTMGKFFSDPQFYDNVTALSGDLRLLVSEFRQDPKKFLHVKLGVF